MKNRCYIVVFLLLLIVSLFTGCGSRTDDLSSTQETTGEDELNTETDTMEGKGLTVSTQFGYQKFVKSGRYARVIVTVDNDSKDFSGSIIIGFPAGNVRNIAYEKEISVLSKRTEKYEIAIPMNLRGDEITVSINDEKDSQILSKKIKVNIAYNSDMAYVGVLTDDNSRYASFVGSKVKLFFLSKEEFPENVLSLDSLDTILIDNFDISTLTDKQKNALERFSKEASVISVDKNWNIENELEDKIEENLSYQSKIRIEKETYGNAGDDEAYSGTQIKNREKIPSLLEYVIAILCYLIIIGPPLYFLLKKLDKPGALWPLVPIFSAIFALIIYGMGTKTRLTQPYIGYLSIMDIGENEFYEQVFFTLASPYNTGYEVTIPKEYGVAVVNNHLAYAESGYLSRQLGGNLMNEYNTSVKWMDEETKITVEDNAAFSKGYYKSERTLEGGMKPKGDIHMSKEYKVTGTVTNSTGYNLTNASLCVGDVYVVIGNMKAGETITLDNLQQEILTSTVQLYEEQILEYLSGGNPNNSRCEERVSRIYNAYQYFLESRMLSFTKEECVLVGFAETESDAEIFREVDYPKDGISMIKMQGNVDYSLGETIFIPNLDTYMHTEDTYYYDTSRYMYSDTMKFQLQFDKSDKIKALIYSKELNSEFKENSLSGFYGTIKVYNYDTKQYDNLFTSGESKTISNISPYLSKKNSISILIEAKTDKLDNESTTIPVLSAVKEAD